MIDQALQRTTEDHARQVVIAKNHVLLTATRCQHTTFGAHLEQAIPLNHRQIMIREPAVTRAWVSTLIRGVRRDVSDEGLRLASHCLVIDGEPVIRQRAPQFGLLVDQQHRGTALRRLQRSTEASRARTHYRHIAKQILLVLVARRR